MNHTAVVGGAAFIKNAIRYLNNQSVPIPLVVGEVGSALGNGKDDSPLEAVLGSALWQVDFFLYSMFIGVQRINLQSGLTFPFALWNPKFTVGNITTPASVRPAFYGQMFAAEFRGDAEDVRIFNRDLNTPFLSAYAAYDGGNLTRVAVVNLRLWNEDDPKARPHKTVALKIGKAATSVMVKKLTSIKGGSASAGNITWGGFQWRAANGGVGKQVLNDIETLPVKDGLVELNLKASEAAMMFVSY